MSGFNHYTGEQLLILIKDGDKAAYTAFCERYRELLLLGAFKRLHDVDEAKDVVQEIFIWIWVKRSKIDISGGVRAYLRGAVFNRTADLIRKNVRRREQYLEYMSHKDLVIDKDHVESKELGQELTLAIELISPASREAFIKSYLEDKSHKEIASEMNINIQSVKNHIQRALKSLRNKF